MSEQLAKLAVVHWALIAGNNAHTLDRMYNELHEPDIHNSVAELREIQSHLNDLDLWFQDPRINRFMPREMRDMEIGIIACSNSLKRLDEIVKRVTTVKRGEPTSRIWGEIKATFKELEGPLSDRLNAHRVWLTQLFPILKMHFIFSKPRNQMELERLQNQIRYVNGTEVQTLHDQRMKEWEEYYRRVATAEHARMASRYAQPPSPQYSPTGGWVPIAPWSTAQPQQQPMYPPQPAGPSAHRYGQPGVTPGGFFQGYPSPPTSTSSANSPQVVRPGFTLYYPSPPVRPTTPTGRSTTPKAVEEDSPYARPASRSSSRTRHKRQASIGNYDSGRPEFSYQGPRSGRDMEGERKPRDMNHETARPVKEPLRRRSRSHGREPEELPKSECFGRHIDSGNVSHASELEVMSLDFEPDMTVSLYRNEVTNASRIVCGNSVSGWLSDQRGGGGTYQGSIKMTALTVRRESPLVLILNRSSKVWARLVFSDFENMIIFFHMFIALRAYSPVQPTESPITIGSSERWLSGEVVRWSGLIDYEDENYRLYLLEDEDTQSVRIAAIVEGMKHNNLTIFTAFLHPHMQGTRQWLEQQSATVILQRVPVYHFSIVLRPKCLPEFPLKFLNSQDATAFREEIEDMSRELLTYR